MNAEETIREFNRSKSQTDNDCLFIRNLKARGVDIETIAIFIEEMGNVCEECYDSEMPCHCWNDE